MASKYLPFTLYSFFKSSTAFRVRIAVNLKGVKPNYKFVNLLAGEQKLNAYKEINPNQGVPALQLADGTVLI
jgi:glutathione S-transferase